MPQGTTNTRNLRYRSSAEDSEQRSDHDTAEASASGYVSEYPVTSAIVTLAAGLGVGLFVSSMFGGSSSSFRAQENAAMRLGRQMMNSMSNIVPDYFSGK